MSSVENAKYIEKKRSLFFGLPLSFTKYIIADDVITIQEGLLNTTENDCYMYKVEDVKLLQSLFEKILGLGTVVCHTGDVTNKEIHLIHIKNARSIKDFILKSSEEDRSKRRTIYSANIGVD